MENMYSKSEIEKMVMEAEKLQQKYPYSESDAKDTLKDKDLQIEEPHQEVVLAKYRKKKIKKLTQKAKTFLTGTSEELRAEFSNENATYGWLAYVAEICSGVLTIDGLFRMGKVTIGALKDGTLFKPDYSNCFDTPGIIGYIREKQHQHK